MLIKLLSRSTSLSEYLDCLLKKPGHWVNTSLFKMSSALYITHVIRDHHYQVYQVYNIIILYRTLEEASRGTLVHWKTKRSANCNGSSNRWSCKAKRSRFYISIAVSHVVYIVTFKLKGPKSTWALLNYYPFKLLYITLLNCYTTTMISGTIPIMDQNMKEIWWKFAWPNFVKTAHVHIST